MPKQIELMQLLKLIKYIKSNEYYLGYSELD